MAKNATRFLQHLKYHGFDDFSGINLDAGVAYTIRIMYILSVFSISCPGF